MKRIIFALLLFVLGDITFAQVPEKISYQAVIRISSDQLVTNINIGMQISISQDSTTGTAVYVERHYPSSNANGLVSIEKGGGTVVSGSFATINWSGHIFLIPKPTFMVALTKLLLTQVKF